MFTSLRNSIYALVALAIAALAGLAFVQLKVSNDLIEALRNAEGQGVAMRNHMQSDMLHDGLLGRINGFMLALREGNEVEVKEETEEARRMTKEFRAEFSKNLQATTLSEATRNMIAQAAPQVSRYADVSEALVKQTDLSADSTSRLRAEHADLFDKLEKVLGVIRDAVESDLRDGRVKADAVAQSSQVTLLASAIIAAVLLACVALLLLHPFQRDVKRVTAVLGEVNSGDLTARTTLRGVGEMAQIGTSIDQLLDEKIQSLDTARQENESLNEAVVALLRTMFELGQRNLTVRAEVGSTVVGTVADSINMLAQSTAEALANVNGVAVEVAGTSARVNDNAQALAGQAQRDQLAVHEMTRDIDVAATQMKHVAQLAEQSRQAAGQATQATLSALKSVTSTVGEMAGIRDSIGEMEKRVKRLGERSQEISQVVTLINSISERTHVLALNASMQAAMAGEAGRGFAVVTEEVQRLADASRNATMQIAQLAHNIQLETSETVAALNRTVSDVVKGSQIAEASGGQMRDTEEANKRLSEAVRQIADEAQRQLDLANRLAQRASALNESTERTQKVVRGTTDDAATLAQHSTRLVQVVSEFKFA